jgi:23S rRNA (uracil1939-C5)-methyltransferase
MPKKNEIIKLNIDALSTDGAGIGRDEDGKAVFVPDSALGDSLEVRIIKVTKNYSVGKIVAIKTEGEGRCVPACVDCTICGGCNFWHIDYETELSYKTRYVSDNLRKIGKLECDVAAASGSPEIERYRNKVIYPVREGKDGEIAFGFFASRSHRLIEPENCRIEPKIFSEIAKETIKFMKKNRVSAYNEETGTGVLRNIYLRKTADGKVMLCLVLNRDFTEKEAFSSYITERFSEIETVVLNYNNKNTNVVLGEKYEIIYGEGSLEDTLCGLKIRISPASFYQINRNQAERLYNKAAEVASLRGDEVLIDLYCGTGTIGLTMASKVKKVFGVEIVPEAIENAKENAKINGIENAEFICGDAADGAKYLKNKGIKPNIVVVDPPRKGCGEATLSIINEMNPEKIVYISCDSATFARDLAILKDLGYDAGTVYPFDMFPRTAHVECCVCLTRK